MLPILSKLLLVLIVILAVPTALILVSQSAVPGDQTYGIKRGMENGLGQILSLNPVTKAYFRTDLSGRRFSEAVTLLKRNETDKTATNTSLRDLLSTTANASADIKNVSDPNLKKTLATNLAKQITTYRQSLAVVAKETPQAVPTPVPSGVQQPTPTPIPGQITLTPAPTGGQIIPTPSTVIGTPTPTSAVRTPTPTATTVVRTPTPSPTTAQCTNVPVDSLLCGGDTGVTQYPATSLLIASVSTNSCTNAKTISVTSTIDLYPLKCKDVISSFTACDASHLQACDDALKALLGNVTTTQNTQSTGNVGATSVKPTSGPTPTGGFTALDLPPNPTPSPTNTPTPTSTQAPISFGGKIISIKTSPYTVGSAMTFTVEATDTHNPSWLATGNLYVTLGNGAVMSDAECGAGHTLEGGGIWCKIAGATLSGNDIKFDGAWTPTKAGDYFTAVNIITKNLELGFPAPRAWCSGNPWCTYKGMTTCPLRTNCVPCADIDYCGYGSYRNFTVAP